MHCKYSKHEVCLLKNQTIDNKSLQGHLYPAIPPYSLTTFFCSSLPIKDQLPKEGGNEHSHPAMTPMNHTKGQQGTATVQLK